MFADTRNLSLSTRTYVRTMPSQSATIAWEWQGQRWQRTHYANS
jgi:hypothetical protein